MFMPFNCWEVAEAKSKNLETLLVPKGGHVCAQGISGIETYAYAGVGA